MKSFLLTVLCVAGIAYLQWQGVRLSAQEEHLDGTIADLEQSNNQQRAKNEKIREDIAAIRQHSNDMFETLAREKLFMIMPDEIYVLPDEEAQ